MLQGCGHRDEMLQYMRVLDSRDEVVALESARGQWLVSMVPGVRITFLDFMVKSFN